NCATVAATRWFGNGNLGANCGVVSVAERHDHRNTIGCPTLKDRDDNRVIFSVRSIGLSESSTHKELRGARVAGESHGTGFEEIPTLYCHVLPLLKLRRSKPADYSLDRFIELDGRARQFVRR